MCIVSPRADRCPVHSAGRSSDGIAHTRTDSPGDQRPTGKRDRVRFFGTLFNASCASGACGTHAVCDQRHPTPCPGRECGSSSGSDHPDGRPCHRNPAARNPPSTRARCGHPGDVRSRGFRPFNVRPRGVRPCNVRLFNVRFSNAGRRRASGRRGSRLGLQVTAVIDSRCG
jgi:hypothetical protein